MPFSIAITAIVAAFALGLGVASIVFYYFHKDRVMKLCKDLDEEYTRAIAKEMARFVENIEARAKAACSNMQELEGYKDGRALAHLFDWHDFDSEHRSILIRKRGEDPWKISIGHANSDDFGHGKSPEFHQAVADAIGTWCERPSRPEPITRTKNDLAEETDPFGLYDDAQEH